MKVCLHINKSPMTTKFRQFHIILVQKVAINRQNLFQLIQAISEKSSLCTVASRIRLRPPPVIRMSPTAATDPTSTGWAPRTLAPVSRLGKEKPLMEMLINGRTVMIRDAIFHNHATGKTVFFLYKLKSVVFNALLSAGKLPLLVDYIYNIRNVTAGKFVGSV